MRDVVDSQDSDSNTASTSETGRFETETLTQKEIRIGPRAQSARRG